MPEVGRAIGLHDVKKGEFKHTHMHTNNGENNDKQQNDQTTDHSDNIVK